MNDFKPGMKAPLAVSLRPDEVITLLRALADRERAIQAMRDWSVAEKAMAIAECTMLSEALMKEALNIGINFSV